MRAKGQCLAEQAEVLCVVEMGREKAGRQAGREVLEDREPV